MDWLRSRLRDLRRAGRLPARERRGLARAALWLLAVDLGLRLLGFSRLQSLLDRRRRTAPPREISELVRQVDVAARHHLYPMRCLRRALVLQAFLREQGIAAELKIGARKGAGGLEAHAWLERQGRPIGEEPGVREDYPPLSATGS